MKTDRRNFLSLFGVSTAAVATMEGVETVHDPDVPEAPKPSIQTRWPAAEFYNVQSRVLYHRIDIGKNEMAPEYHAFTGIDHEDYSRTNVHRYGALIQPQAFAVSKIGIVFSSRSQRGMVAAFADRYDIRFLLMNKVYWQSPLAFLATVGDGPLDSLVASTMKFSEPKAWPLSAVSLNTLSIPVVITDETHFGVSIYGTPIKPCSKLSFWVCLQGDMAVPIQ